MSKFSTSAQIWVSIGVDVDETGKAFVTVQDTDVCAVLKVQSVEFRPWSEDVKFALEDQSVVILTNQTLLGMLVDTSIDDHNSVPVLYDRLSYQQFIKRSFPGVSCDLINVHFDLVQGDDDGFGRVTIVEDMTEDAIDAFAQFYKTAQAEAKAK